jgi:exopolyphosphatase/guanosine-5'-triphosphate,3'-diphosphate pyrophosphatase
VIRRKEIPGLDPSRADIILGGAILLSRALAWIGSSEVAVSTRGLRWGLLYDRFLETRHPLY